MVTEMICSDSLEVFEHSILPALAKDLSKFTGSLERMVGGVYALDGGALTRSLPDGKFELRFNPGIVAC